MNTRLFSYLIISIISLMNCKLTFGQSYNFINYGIGDGLAHDRVVDMCEDQFGNLWLATAGGGLSKFNGVEFKNYTIKNGLPSNYIRSVINDRRGNIWVSTASGISKLNGKEIKNFILDSLNENGNSVNKLFQSADGNIWFSAPAGGLGKIDSLLNVKFIEMPINLKADKIIDIDEDSNGNLWFISAVQGLFKYHNDQFEHVIKNADYKGYLLSVQIDKEGLFWIGSNNGLIKFDPSKGSSVLQYQTILKNTFVKSTVIKTEQQFWVISTTGVLKFDEDIVKSVSARQGLTDVTINSIYIDREENVWFGSDGKGLFKLANESFVFYTKSNGLPSLPITSIIKDNDDNYWFGSFDNGIQKFDGIEFTSLTDQENLPSGYISASAKDHRGNLWFGTRSSGLFMLDGKTAIQYGVKDGLAHNRVRQLFFDSMHNLWIGTLNGLSRYDGNSFENFDTTKGLYDNVIWGISENEKGHVLIVTRNGLSEFSNGKMTKIEIDDEIFDRRINTVLKDHENNYWIGYSGHGLLKLNNKGVKTYITVDQGLTSDLIYNLMMMDNGDILVGSERGIDKIELNEDREVINIKNYGAVEGFKNLKTSYGITFKDDDGLYWFGNDEGIFKFDSKNEKKNSIEPIVYISGLKLFYNEVDWTTYSKNVSNWLNIPSNLELPYSQNNLIIEYFGNSLSNSEAVKYKFRLIGLENEWSPISGKTEAVYTNLSPGQYVFEVMAANSDNIWSAQPAEFRFIIVPPFWQETWFYILIIVSLLLGIKFYNNYKVKVRLDKILTIEKIRSEELLKVRKKMARDFHDNMGNQLASITVYANLINLKLKDKSKEIDDLLGNIQKHTNSLFAGTKDFIWSMDPESDNLSEIFTYIKDFGEDLFDRTEITFYSKADDFEGNIYPVPSGWSRQLVLIFKEGMTNALKHSGASEVHLELKLSEANFLIKFSDNGKGIDQTATKGMGLKNMHSRAVQISGALSIQHALNNQGTEILFTGNFQSEHS